MLNKYLAAAAACLLASLHGAWADPAQDSCHFLAVVGGNQPEGVGPLLGNIAAKWIPESRSRAVATLTDLMSKQRFAGGSVYRIARLGEDLEEHLVLLRLDGGELAGARLLYEWTPDGIRLTTLDFQRKYAEIIARPFLMAPEPIACP